MVKELNGPLFPNPREEIFQTCKASRAHFEPEGEEEAHQKLADSTVTNSFSLPPPLFYFSATLILAPQWFGSLRITVVLVDLLCEHSNPQ